ncbi:hypothetical protein [Pandoraea sputorum]|uniref:hypothetical protein n=1 Tax=Pandoraea sputorum TaxID=93222 RepID=UPI002F409347
MLPVVVHGGVDQCPARHFERVGDDVSPASAAIAACGPNTAAASTAAMTVIRRPPSEWVAFPV